MPSCVLPELTQITLEQARIVVASLARKVGGLVKEGRRFPVVLTT